MRILKRLMVLSAMIHAKLLLHCKYNLFATCHLQHYQEQALRTERNKSGAKAGTRVFERKNCKKKFR